MEKKAKQFVRLLSKTLIENERTNEHEEGMEVARLQDKAKVNQAFRSALDDLPKCALRTELQKNAATYSRKLEVLTRNGQDSSQNGNKKTKKKRNDKNLLKEKEDTLDSRTTCIHLKMSDAGKMKAGHQIPSSKMTPQRKECGRKVKDKIVSSEARETDEDDIIDAMVVKEAHCDSEGSQIQIDGKSPYAFNTYATHSRIEVIDGLTKLPLQKKLRLAPHAVSCLCKGSSFTEFMQILHPEVKHEEVCDAMAILQQEILTVLGTSDCRVLIRCLADCLSGVITEADKILHSNNNESLKSLQNFLVKLLLWVKLRYEDHRERLQASQGNLLTNFDDLLAAILSIYVDVSVILSRSCPDNVEANGRHTLSTILLVIGPSLIDRLNLLLQVTIPTSEDSQFMVPIYRHTLSKKPIKMTNEIFIKYVCAVRFSREILNEHQQKVREDIIKVAMTAEPSKDFLLWMFNVIPEAYSSLPDAVKSRKIPLVKYLLFQANKECMDRLLDIVSNAENDSQVMLYETSQDQTRSSSISQDSGHQDTERLFFTDITRDEDIARHVDVHSDFESVGALDSRYDDLMENFEKEDSDSSEDGEYLLDAVKAQRANISQDKKGENEKDHISKEVKSDIEEQEGIIVEEQRYDQVKENDLDEEKDTDEDSLQNSINKTKRQKMILLSSNEVQDPDDVLIIPDSEDHDHEMESEKDSFTTAKDNIGLPNDNLGKARESVIIDVDDEITFKIKGDHSDEENEVEVVQEKDEEEVTQDEEDDLADGDKIVEEVDGLPNPEPLTEHSISKHSPRKSKEESPKDLTKMQEGGSDEVSSQRMCLRSMNSNQSSLLRFFTPINRSSEESYTDIQQPQKPHHQIMLNSEVIPNSSDSEQEQNLNTSGAKAATCSLKSLKLLEEISAKPEQREAVTILTNNGDDEQQSKQAVTPSGKKQQKNFLSRSARKTRSTDNQESSSRDVNIPKNMSPVVRLPKMSSQSENPIKQNLSMNENAVAEGIRRIRAECATSPMDLQVPTKTRSIKKLKRKSLTITGGLKSKTLSVNPKQGTTPADKIVSKSAEKRKELSPVEKWVKSFGDTYCILAGFPPDSQINSDSLPPPSQGSPKRMKLQPKDLKEMFVDERTPSTKPQKRQTADIQPISESSQESVQSAKRNISSIKKQSKIPLISPKRNSRTLAEPGSLSSQIVDRSKTDKTPGINMNRRLDEASHQMNTVSKMRYSLTDLTKSTKATVKVSRKSLGGKK